MQTYGLNIGDSVIVSGSIDPEGYIEFDDEGNVTFTDTIILDTWNHAILKIKEFIFYNGKTYIRANSKEFAILATEVTKLDENSSIEHIIRFGNIAVKIICGSKKATITNANSGEVYGTITTEEVVKIIDKLLYNECDILGYRANLFISNETEIKIGCQFMTVGQLYEINYLMSTNPYYERLY